MNPTTWRTIEHVDGVEGFTCDEHLAATVIAYREFNPLADEIEVNGVHPGTDDVESCFRCLHAEAAHDTPILPRPTGYTAQCAIDAQASEYGGRGYWDELERSSLRHYVYFAERGDRDQARAMLTRSLSEALRGNDGI